MLITILWGMETVSQLDVLVSSSIHPDSLEEIICSKDNNFIRSSHDVIVSSFSLSSTPILQAEVPKAPRLQNKRFWVVWDNVGIHQYISTLSSSFPKLVDELGDSSDPIKVVYLLSNTPQILISTAWRCLKTIELSRPPKPRRPKSDPLVRSLY